MADDPTIFDLLGPGQPERPVPVPDVADGGELTDALIAAAVAALRARGPLLPPADIPPAPHGQRVWVYDTEVFPNLVLHVFTDGRSTEVFHQGTWDALRTFVSDPGKVLAGFNSSGYDDPVLRRILARPHPTLADIFALSGEIIGGELPRELRWGPVPWAHGIDVLQLLNGRGSLKEWECRLGLDLVAESPCDFAAPLPAGAIGEVLRYCLNDVAATVRLLLANWDLVAMRAVLQGIYGQSDTIYATTEAGIAEATLADLARRASGVTRSQLKAAAAANPDNRPRTWPLDGLIAPRVTFVTPPFCTLLAAVRAGSLVIGARGGALDLPQLPGQVFTHDGTLYQLGTGGLHSLDQPGSWRADTDTALIDLDVTSYYPSLIINEGWHPRHYGPAFVEHLRGMRDRRVAAKNAGDKRTATALKIVINSIYGKLNDAYSSIRSVPDAFRVTLNGQLLLLMLIEGLSSAGAEVLSANTDGVTVRVPRVQLAAVEAAAAAWERASALTLERTSYRALHRRDVNNYLAITAAGELKTRGAFGDGAKGDGAVVREAAVAWLVEGIEPSETVARCSDVRAFLFYQRTRSDALLVHGERALGRIARWYVGFGGPTLRRRSLAEGTLTTVAHGHHARLAMDIAGWTMADLTTLDRSAYVAEAWRLINAVAPREGLVGDG